MSEVDATIDTNLTPKKKDATKARQKRFLKAYAEYANVLIAARAAGVSRQIVYVWLEKDEDFSFAYNIAKEDARDCLRSEIYRRGIEGWDEPIYQQGKLVGQVRKYSDVLLIFHTKALCPEYREKSQIDLNANVSTTAQAGSLTLDMRNASASELARLKEIALEMKAREQGL